MRRADGGSHTATADDARGRRKTLRKQRPLRSRFRTAESAHRLRPVPLLDSIDDGEDLVRVLDVFEREDTMWVVGISDDGLEVAPFILELLPAALYQIPEGFLLFGQGGPATRTVPARMSRTMRSGCGSGSGRSVMPKRSRRSSSRSHSIL